MSKPGNYMDKMIEHMKFEVNRKVYCQICGEEIDWQAQNDNEPDANWERDNRVHKYCFIQEARKRGMTI